MESLGEIVKNLNSLTYVSPPECVTKFEKVLLNVVIDPGLGVGGGDFDISSLVQPIPQAKPLLYESFKSDGDVALLLCNVAIAPSLDYQLQSAVFIKHWTV